MEGEAPSRRGGPRSRLGKLKVKGEDSVEVEESEDTEVEAALAGVPEASEAPNIALSNKSLVSKDNGANYSIHGTTHSRSCSQGKLKTASMKAPDYFNGTQAHKLRVFIQSCQLIFHNDPENFFSDRKKALYSTFFLTGRAGKWIEPYISNISNEDLSYLLNN
ncbi:hypothetical protein O181_083351 [Austropuccinia psidii MF-1]|uniref:DUF4939 domain-containing protein n=1 Tax=Austropuccinia psidii MF-1 TaxID=1389203 RepID=A0A9Q3FUE5_9BASI|nr:hypothetical protein [Austropuccinia psidii MF-1]